MNDENAFARTVALAIVSVVAIICMSITSCEVTKRGYDCPSALIESTLKQQESQ